MGISPIFHGVLCGVLLGFLYVVDYRKDTNAYERHLTEWAKNATSRKKCRDVATNLELHFICRNFAAE